MQNKNVNRIPVLMLTLCALFAALMAVGAWISIPIFSIPVTLQLLAIMVCAALLPPRYALMSVCVYVLLGLVGLPVFSGFTGGIAKLFSITGGYIIGFIPAAWVTSLIITKWGREIWKQIIAMIIGVLICYLFGTVWFMLMNQQNVAAFNAGLNGKTEEEILAAGGLKSAYSLSQTLGMCVIPYIPFDAVKIAISAVLSKALWQPMKKILKF